MMLGPFRDASGVALTLPRTTLGVVRAILAHLGLAPAPDPPGPAPRPSPRGGERTTPRPPGNPRPGARRASHGPLRRGFSSIDGDCRQGSRLRRSRGP